MNEFFKDIERRRLEGKQKQNQEERLRLERYYRLRAFQRPKYEELGGMVLGVLRQFRRALGWSSQQLAEEGIPQFEIEFASVSSTFDPPPNSFDNPNWKEEAEKNVASWELVGGYGEVVAIGVELRVNDKGVPVCFRVSKGIEGRMDTRGLSAKELVGVIRQLWRDEA